ncbi:MAG TPA: diaminopimelate epimerase [Bryobacteraceae bacterium]|nr:diaminopimelate epimerase [Bryobacteraceae bacterium]
MKIPFTKAHGTRNDFLLTWEADVPEDRLDGLRAETARALCDRHTGVGADGWMVVTPPAGAEAEGAIQLYNSDGGMAEMSGNGTRCAAAFLIRHGLAAGVVRVRTGAGIKTLRLLERHELAFVFEMDMGRPEIVAERFFLPLDGGPLDVTLLAVGNPQCAVPVTTFDFDWRALGAEIESHPHFPRRTNVSFLRALDEHTLDVRFWERGAGETMSSGTGSVGAVVAAVARGMAKSPVSVRTSGGALELRWESSVYLTGPAEIVAEGQFFL